MARPASRYVVAVVAFVAFIYSWDVNMMQPTLPHYAIDIGASAGIMGMIMGLYAVTNSAGNVLLGRLSDAWGRRVPLTLGFLGSAIALLFYGMTTDATSLGIVRAIHGFFSGALGPCSAAILADLAPAERKGMYMGVWVMFVSLGVAVGSPLAGTLASTVGYVSVWILMATFYAITVVVAWSLLPETHRTKHTVTTNAYGGTPVPAVQKARPRSILSRRSVWIACLGGFAMFWVTSALVVPFNGYHLAALKASGEIGAQVSIEKGMAFGVLMGAFGAAAVLLSSRFGSLSDVVGRRPLVVAGFVLLSLMPFAVAARSLAVVVLGWMAGYALAAAMVWPALMALLTDELAEHERGMGMGFFGLFLTLGAAVGMPLMGFLNDRIGTILTIQLSAIAPIAALVLSFFGRWRQGHGAAGRGLKIYIGVGSAVVVALAFPLIMWLSGAWFG